MGGSNHPGRVFRAGIVRRVIAPSVCWPIALPRGSTGTLLEVETVVLAAEQAPSREAAADELRLDIELPGALRWMRRRLQAVYLALQLLRGLMPELFTTAWPTLRGFRACLGVEVALLALRKVAAAHLPHAAPTARIPAPASAWR